jgi:hypothetical protein
VKKDRERTREAYKRATAGKGGGCAVIVLLTVITYAMGLIATHYCI